MREQTVGRPYGGRVLCGARTSLLSQRSAPRPETQEVTLPLGPKFQAERKTRKFLHPTTAVRLSARLVGLVWFVHGSPPTTATAFPACRAPTTPPQ